MTSRWQLNQMPGTSQLDTWLAKSFHLGQRTGWCVPDVQEMADGQGMGVAGVGWIGGVAGMPEALMTRWMAARESGMAWM